MGFEPTTFSLATRCSTPELHLPDVGRELALYEIRRRLQEFSKKIDFLPPAARLNVIKLINAKVQEDCNIHGRNNRPGDTNTAAVADNGR